MTMLWKFFLIVFFQILPYLQPFFMLASITFISKVSGKTFLIKTLDKGSQQTEAGEEYGNDDELREGDMPSGYKETKDSMESKG